MADFFDRLRRLVSPNPAPPNDTSDGSAAHEAVSTKPPAAREQLATLTAMGLAFEPWATPERMTRDLIRNIDAVNDAGHPKPGGAHRRGAYWWPLEVYPRLACSSIEWRTTLFAPSRRQRGLLFTAGPLEAWDDYLPAQARAFPHSVRPAECVVLAHAGTEVDGRIQLLVDGQTHTLPVGDFAGTGALDATQSLLSLLIPEGKTVVAPEPPGMVGNARTCYLINADQAEEFRLLWRRFVEPVHRDAHRHAFNRPLLHAAALETPGLPPEGTPPPVLDLPVPDVPLAEQLATLRALGLETAPGVGEQQLAEALENRARPCPDGSPDPGVGPYLGLLRLRGQRPRLVTITRDPLGPDEQGWSGWRELQEDFIVPLKTAEKEFQQQLQWFRAHDFERQLAADALLDVRGHLMVLEGMGFPVHRLVGRSEEQLRELIDDSLPPAERPTVWRGLFEAMDFETWTPLLGHTFSVPDTPLDYFGVWEQVVRDIATAAGTTGLLDEVSTTGEGEDGVLSVRFAGRTHDFRPEYAGKHLDRVVVAELCELLSPPGHTAVETGGFHVWVRTEAVGEFRRRILPALA